MKRTTRPAIPVALVLLSALAGACVTEEEGTPPPLDGLQFPTGMALAPPEASGRQLLLVASGNFDLRFRAGVLHAFDLAEIDRLADTAVPPPDCPPGPDGLPSRCRTPEVFDLAPALVGAVEIGNFAGQVAVASLPDRLRAFVPVREGDGVVAVDLPPGGAPVCTAGGEGPCAAAVRFPGDDPQPVKLIGNTVYVASIRTGKDGRLAYAAADDAIWTTGGKMASVFLGEQAAGGIAHRCEPVAPEAPECSAGGTLFVSGRSIEDLLNPLYLLPLPPDGPATGPVTTVNLYSQQRGLDARGVAVSTDGATLYLASRYPDALAIVDVAQLYGAGADGCVVLPPAPPDFRCPSTGQGEPILGNRTLVPTSAGPNDVTVLPRTLPGGGTSDLVLVTTENSLDFIDTRIDVLAARLDDLGPVPSAVVYRPLGTGYRLYVSSFGRGTIAVVDLPDPFRPELARVVALLGRVQEGSL